MQLKLFRLLFKLLDAVAPSLASRIAVAFFYAPRSFVSALWEKTALAVGKDAQFEFAGEILDATIWGRRGPVVLLVHGWEGRRSQLGKIAVNLSGRGYRVVAFDGPAHGSSEKKRTSLVEFAKAVQCAEQQFGPFHAIVGHSFGAAAAAIAVRHGVTANRIVLISCPFSLRNVVSGFARFVGLPTRSHERMYPIMESLHGCHESELSFMKIGPDLHLPCLIVHDESDKYIPFIDGERVHQSIKHSRIIKTSGLGHMRILQDEQVVHRIASFVDEPAQTQRLSS